MPYPFAPLSACTVAHMAGDSYTVVRRIATLSPSMKEMSCDANMTQGRRHTNLKCADNQSFTQMAEVRTHPGVIEILIQRLRQQVTLIDD